MTQFTLDLGFPEIESWILHGRKKDAWTLMIPKRQFKRAVIRFELATRALKCARAAGPKERASIQYEFRAAKRELLALGNLLITGEMPDKAYSPASLPVQQIQAGTERYGEPKTSGGVGPT